MLGEVRAVTGMSEFTEGRSVKRQGREPKAETGGAPGMAAGGGCAEAHKGDAILCAQVHQGQGGGWCSEDHCLTFEKAVSRESRGETNGEGEGE